MDTKKILYAGDTSLTTAGGYLAGILTHYNMSFDYVASDKPIAPLLSDPDYALYIISDYPVNNWRDEDFEIVLQAVEQGAGLLMIGGWESYHGLAGEYHNSPLAEVLPVEMQTSDDRANCPQPCIVETLCGHVITSGLPFDRPPTIGGYNRVKMKKNTTQVLALRHLKIVTAGEGKYQFKMGQIAPLLVVGSFGRGRTAAFTSDVAPHWIGTFVDWGDERVNAGTVEIGNHYAEFFARLVQWTMKTEITKTTKTTKKNKKG